MINIHLPRGVHKTPHIHLWSSPKSSPYGFSCNYQCVSALPSNVVRFKYMIHYQRHVKVLLLHKQITANHTLYFWPCLKCSLLPIALSLPFYLYPFIFPSSCVYRQDGFSYSSPRYRSHQRKSKPSGEEMKGMEIMLKNATIRHCLA